MAAWDELKVVLARLRDEQPGVLMQYPMPEVDEGRVPPFEIHLAPWATATAGELYRQFGDDVDLTVGALPYPPGRPPRPQPASPADHLPGGARADRAGPAADRHGKLHSPDWLHHPGRELGNPGNAHPRPRSPPLTPQAHPGPAADHHRLTGNHT